LSGFLEGRFENRAGMYFAQGAGTILSAMALYQRPQAPLQIARVPFNRTKFLPSDLE
jgi:hypothetical protein